MIFECATCGVVKPLSDYYPDKTTKRGHHKHCKECQKVRNRERLSAPEKKAERRAAYRNMREDPERNAEYLARIHALPLTYVLYHGAKRRAKLTGLTFTIAQADIIVPEACPLLGIPLAKGPGRIHDNSPSLDRIVPEFGYIPGNILVISYRANRIKNDSTPDELELLAFNLRKIWLRS